MNGSAEPESCPDSKIDQDPAATSAVHARRIAAMAILGFGGPSIANRLGNGAPKQGLGHN